MDEKQQQEQGPVDPFTPAQLGFVSLYEMFTGLRAVGASIREAAAIVGAIVAANGNGTSGNG